MNIQSYSSIAFTFLIISLLLEINRPRREEIIWICWFRIRKLEIVIAKDENAMFAKF